MSRVIEIESDPTSQARQRSLWIARQTTRSALATELRAQNCFFDFRQDMPARNKFGGMHRQRMKGTIPFQP